jgi:hypothetical protein
MGEAYRLAHGGLAFLHDVGDGCEIVSVADGFDLTGPAAEIILAVVSWAAKMEQEPAQHEPRDDAAARPASAFLAFSMANARCRPGRSSDFALSPRRRGRPDSP